jgi:hypothetical protein
MLRPFAGRERLAALIRCHRIPALPDRCVIDVG